MRRRLCSFLGLCAAVSVLSACAGSGGSGLTELKFVGRIPGINSAGGSLVVDGVKASLSPLEGSTLGSRAPGNRVLVIGDSILAGTASRYGGAMCAALVPMGWQVAVEAEAGQMVGFGRTVVRDRIYEGWDAAVVFLGTNYGGSKENYERDLTRIVESLAPRPTLLITATLFRDTMQQVNDVIRVVASIAAALGPAPEVPGKCLVSKYTDDSLVEDDVMPTTTAPGATIPYATTTTTGSAAPAPSSTAVTTTTVRQ